MRTRPVLAILLTSVLLGGVLGLSLRSSADNVTPIPVRVKKKAGKPRVKSAMLGKQLGAQTILDGLIHHDFATIKKGAESLKYIGLDGQRRHSGNKVEDKIYDHFRLEFLRLAGKLETMAEKKNMEGAAYTYQNLTATCIACHEYLRDSHKKNAK